MHTFKDKYAGKDDGVVAVPTIQITGMDSKDFANLHVWMTFEERIASAVDPEDPEPETGDEEYNVVNEYPAGISKADIVSGLSAQELAGLRLGIRALIRVAGGKVPALADSEFDPKDIM